MVSPPSKNGEEWRTTNGGPGRIPRDPAAGLGGPEGSRVLGRGTVEEVDGTGRVGAAAHGR